MKRREFLAGVAGAAPALAFPVPFGRPIRFAVALQRAIRIKREAGELGAMDAERCEFALGRRVRHNGRVASVARHVQDEVDPPWWRNILTWILENWEIILKVLLTFVALLEVQ